MYKKTSFKQNRIEGDGCRALVALQIYVYNIQCIAYTDKIAVICYLMRCIGLSIAILCNMNEYQLIMEWPPYGINKRQCVQAVHGIYQLITFMNLEVVLLQIYAAMHIHTQPLIATHLSFPLAMIYYI